MWSVLGYASACLSQVSAQRDHLCWCAAVLYTFYSAALLLLVWDRIVQVGKVAGLLVSSKHFCIPCHEVESPTTYRWNHAKC